MSRGKKAYLQYESQLSEAVARITPLREQLTSAIDADAESYKEVMKAYRAAKEAKEPGRRQPGDHCRTPTGDQRTLGSG